MTATDDDIDSGACFQTFHTRGGPDLVRIPAVRHPVRGDLYIIWSDIRHCFPGVARIQFDNIYVPMLRDEKTLLRVKPHGIRYHAGIVLDVVYEDWITTAVKQRRKQSSLQSKQGRSQQGPYSVSATAVSDTPNTLAITTTQIPGIIESQSQRPAHTQQSIAAMEQLKERRQAQQAYQQPNTTRHTSQESNYKNSSRPPVSTPPSTLKFDPPQRNQEQKQQQSISPSSLVAFHQGRDVRKARGITTYPAMPGTTAHLVPPSRSPSVSSLGDDLHSSGSPISSTTQQRTIKIGTGGPSLTPIGISGAFTMSVPLPSQLVAAAAPSKRSREEPASDYEHGVSEGDDEYEHTSYPEEEEYDYEDEEFIRYMNGEISEDDDDEDDEEEQEERGSNDNLFEDGITGDASSNDSEAGANDKISGENLGHNAEDVSGEDVGDGESGQDGQDDDYEIPPSEGEQEDITDSCETVLRKSDASNIMGNVSAKVAPPSTIDLAAVAALTFRSSKGLAPSKVMTMALTNSPAAAGRLPLGAAISSVPVIDMTVTHQGVDTDLNSWDRRAAIAETMRIYSTKSQPFTRPPRRGPLTIEDLVEHRVKNVLMTRQRWIEAASPRFFCILPTSDELASRAAIASSNWDPSTDIEATPLAMTHANPPKATPDPSAADFHFFFICDCCDVPGYEDEWFPHGSLKEGVHNYDLTLGVVDDMIPKYGEYIMGVLEMLKYGAYIDNRLKFPAQTDTGVQRRLSVAIKFLESRNILSCAKYYAQHAAELEKDPSGASLLAGMVPIEPLSKTMTKVLARRLEMTHVPMFEGMSPYRTKAGDIRWVCLPHWYGMSPQEEWAVLNKFQDNLKFIKSEYHTNLSTFRATAMSRVKAQEYYKLAGKMTTTCVFRLFCDFDMNPQDEAHLCAAVDTFAAACVHITVRPKVGVHDGAMHGFAKGYWTISLAALANKKLEGFRMVQGTSDEPPNFRAHYERSDLERSTTDHVRLLTRMKRSAKDGRLNVTMVVTDIDRAVNTIRRHVKGVHHFSKLVLATDFVHNEVQARFARPGSGVFGCDVEDSNYEEDLESFFVRRSGCDTVKYTCVGMPDNLFLMSRALATVQMAFSLVRDRIKVRELIKHSKALSSLTLQNSTKDDPSQIYESLKALLANHPSLKELSVQHRQGSSRPSSFIWHNPNDVSKMRVHMSFSQGDKVLAMFQKYATSIEELTVDGIESADATVFEKSMRAKKGPLKLCRVVLRGLHLWEPFALEEFKKVILRLSIMEVIVSGGIEDHEEFPHDAQAKENGYVVPMTPRTRKGKGLSIAARVAIWFEFIFAIRGSLTGLNIWGKATSQLVQMLGTRLEEAIQMPMLNELTLSGEWKVSLLHYPWIERLIEYKGESKFRHCLGVTTIEEGKAALAAAVNPCIPTPEPIRSKALLAFDISRIPILDSEWERILKHLDLRRLREFLVRQPNPMSPQTLAAIVDRIPQGTLMETFSIDEDMGLSRDDVIFQHRRIKEKATNKITIMINGYISRGLLASATIAAAKTEKTSKKQKYNKAPTAKDPTTQKNPPAPTTKKAKKSTPRTTSKKPPPPPPPAKIPDFKYSKTSPHQDLDSLQVLVDQLLSTNATVSKRDILAQHPEQAPLMAWIYDPLRQFYVRPTNIIRYAQRWANQQDEALEVARGVPTLDSRIDGSTFSFRGFSTLSSLLEALATRSISGHASLDAILQFMDQYCGPPGSSSGSSFIKMTVDSSSSPATGTYSRALAELLSTPRSKLLLKILDKNLKAGCSIGTIREVYPTLIPGFHVALGQMMKLGEAEALFMPPMNMDQGGGIDSIRNRDEFFRLALGLNDDSDKSALPEAIILDGEMCVFVAESVQEQSATTIAATGNSTSRSSPVIVGMLEDDGMGREMFTKAITFVTRGIVEDSFPDTLDDEHSKLSVDKRASPTTPPHADGSEELTLEFHSPLYCVFDCLTDKEFKDRQGTRPFLERIQGVTRVLTESDRVQDGDGLIKVLCQTKVESFEQLQKMVARGIERGWEGVVLRRNCGYEGKRSRNLLKIKQFQEAEFIVKEAILGTMRLPLRRKYEERNDVLTSVVVVHRGNRVRVGSGFSAEERIRFGKDPSLIVGKTITVKYFEESKTYSGSGTSGGGGSGDEASSVSSNDGTFDESGDMMRAKSSIKASSPNNDNGDEKGDIMWSLRFPSVKAIYDVGPRQL
ncbi:hypothetical protein EC991_004259 [Linnemannia zychae]|nr:hypothetical protein EC991_004259 [Linnemannia zychae]